MFLLNLNRWHLQCDVTATEEGRAREEAAQPEPAGGSGAASRPRTDKRPPLRTWFPGRGPRRVQALGPRPARLAGLQLSAGVNRERNSGAWRGARGPISKAPAAAGVLRIQGVGTGAQLRAWSAPGTEGPVPGDH